MPEALQQVSGAAGNAVHLDPSRHGLPAGIGPRLTSALHKPAEGPSALELVGV